MNGQRYRLNAASQRSRRSSQHTRITIHAPTLPAITTLVGRASIGQHAQSIQRFDGETGLGLTILGMAQIQVAYPHRAALCTGNDSWHGPMRAASHRVVGIEVADGVHH